MYEITHIIQLDTMLYSFPRLEYSQKYRTPLFCFAKWNVDRTQTWIYARKKGDSIPILIDNSSPVSH